MSVVIPETHRDLIEKPIVATLATVIPGGQPHTTSIWRKFDGTHVLFTTGQGTQKVKNLEQNPQVSLMNRDPENPYRYLEIRGTVEEISQEEAIEQLDELTKIYTGKPTYYGHIVPAENATKTVHLLCKIKPTKVVAWG